LLSRRVGQVLAFTLVLLSVGVGLCLFDGHTHDHDGPLHAVDFDLCLGLAIVSVAGVGFTSVLIHAMPLERPLAVRVVSLHTPDPPPKPPSRF
jgi:hypothetical protein